ncbi:hypothetical protein DL991_40890 [Amycolatopsis sp. WAC 01375]|uniref:hypothetical protein n=1 Tax=Amycolatopsis sp. WAC 01375 TaxID=2203194 RepID=UPI000F7A7830|nr:hypothetical protein [Amycolatopsis sp. WAC 01375]RSM68936.1 hypothetical protein DL991_40890 [Amycolatopsis sp. WAC 01375]
MPRRGDRQRSFPPAGREADEPASRVGIRVVHAKDRTGRECRIQLDPAEFACSTLAGELADEWVDHIEAVTARDSTATYYRQGIRSFCRAVDDQLGADAAAASLASSRPRLGPILLDWERRLPSGSRPGSTRPAVIASALRGLIVLRAQHGRRPVDDNLLSIMHAPSTVEWGRTDELDEFSRAEKTSMIRAAWSDIHALEERLRHGWDRSSRGVHPDEPADWLVTDNLLRGLADRSITPEEIPQHLPPFHDWPTGLREQIPYPATAGTLRGAKQALVRRLLALLYPRSIDLHPFRVLMIAATGHTAEEITALTTGDVEFTEDGARLRLTKNRAKRARTHVFTDRPRLEVSNILRRLLTVTEHARLLAGDMQQRLFTAVGLTSAFQLSAGLWSSQGPNSFRAWLDAAGIKVCGTTDIRRLRKSTKVEKAIAFGGRVADIANDHHEETFRRHYAQGTTLRILSGDVIATAQQHWFDTALTGPTVLTTKGMGNLSATTEQLDALGLTAEEAEHLRQGTLDMGLTQCRDPFDSPYSRPGTLCAVAPLRCLECRNAWVLPDNLPQLVLFADHLDRLRRRMLPEHFAALWGQSYVNLTAALAERTDEELALARRQIGDGASLHLPLRATVEFDL